MDTNRFLYLSQEDIASINLSITEIIDAVEFSLIEKANGYTSMPPKHWIPSGNKRFFSAMSSSVPSINAVACKWQSGSPENMLLGLPYLTGLLMLNNIETGVTSAIMDSTWITAKRTAAASTVAMRHLANPEIEVLGIIGCGLQGRMHIEAMAAEQPKITTVKAYDICQKTLNSYANEIRSIYDLNVQQCKSPQEVAEGAQVVVTGGPIKPYSDRAMDSNWLEPGTLAISIDYDCYWDPKCMQAIDRFFTDDHKQIKHLREFDYFIAIPNIDAELGEVITGLKPGRISRDNILLTLNLGVSVEDTVIAQKIYERAIEKKLGNWLKF